MFVTATDRYYHFFTRSRLIYPKSIKRRLTVEMMERAPTLLRPNYYSLYFPAAYTVLLY